MRLKLIVLSVIMITAVQVSSGKGIFELGIKAGANLSTPTGVPGGFDITNEAGYVVGGYAQVGLGDLLAVGAELLYENRSFTLTQSGTSANSFDGTTGSLNLPLVLKIGLPLGFNLDIGYQFSQFLSKPEEFQAESQNFGIFGLEWHPLDRFRIGARFQPGFSAFDIQGVDDVSANVTQLYVAFALI